MNSLSHEVILSDQSEQCGPDSLPGNAVLASRNAEIGVASQADSIDKLRVSEMEMCIAETMAAVLKLDRVEGQDNFFALGGDSLRGMQVVVRLNRRLACELPISALFQCPTPALLAVQLEELATSHEIDELAVALAKLSAEERDTVIAEAHEFSS